jgi:aryl-alcohol dehydrogenase-like predicted oxidoreductase
VLAEGRQARYFRGMTSQPPPRRQLGASGPVVFPLALGCMGMSDFYGPADEAESIATIHAALDAGITLLDTGDYYAAGHNELLIGRALRDRRDKAVPPSAVAGTRYDEHQMRILDSER